MKDGMPVREENFGTPDRWGPGVPVFLKDYRSMSCSLNTENGTRRFAAGTLFRVDDGDAVIMWNIYNRSIGKIQFTDFGSFTS